MTQAYAHSSAFASLKGVRETITGNLTSGQYLTALDTLLERAYIPIIQSTSAFDGFLGQVLGWQEVSRKRKVSFLKREDFVPTALSWMALPSPDSKAAQAPNLKLDRAVLAEFVTAFLEGMADYEKACTGSLTRNGQVVDLAEQVDLVRRTEEDCDASQSLLGIIRESRYWLACYVQFQTAILEKYYRMCLMAAQKDYQTVFGRKLRLSDVVQTYQMAAIRAVDKCDPRQGVVTTHIKFWLYSARAALTRDRVLQDQTCQLPDYDNDVGSDDPDESIVPQDEALEKESHRERLLELARLVDATGVGRMFLGLHESPQWLRRVTSC